MTERGKRKTARQAFAAWGMFSVFCAAMVVVAGLKEHQTDALVALHLAVTGGVVPLVVGLFGLDVAQLRKQEPDG